MAKKKTSNKTGAKHQRKGKAKPQKPTKPTAKSKKAAAKQTISKADAKTSKPHPRLEHWQRRPGTFVYELVHKNGSKWVCHAKHAMNDEDLFTQFILHNTFDMSEPLKPGETKIFNAVDNPMKTFDAMFKNPPKGWIQYARRTLIQHRVRQKESEQKKLRRQALAKLKDKNQMPVTKNGVCVNCHGRRWVCEDHPTLPWEMRDGTGCPCCAPSMACPDCNPKSSAAMGPAYSLLLKSPFTPPMEPESFEFPGSFGFPMPPFDVE